jgi:nucleotide-binding universal stress UspA family protein
MANHKQILVAIDDFKDARPLLKYVGDLVCGRADYKIHLFHALEPLPPQLMESPGAENPKDEARVEKKQKCQQDRWVDRAVKRIEALFAASKSQLASARVPPDDIQAHISPLNHRADLVAEIVKTARENNCGTIVVGYGSYPWIREQLHTHVSEQLMAASDNFAVCVVRN